MKKIAPSGGKAEIRCELAALQRIHHIRIPHTDTLMMGTLRLSPASIIFGIVSCSVFLFLSVIIFCCDFYMVVVVFRIRFRFPFFGDVV